MIGEENALAGSLVDSHFQQVLPLENDLALGDFVVLASGQYMGQRTLTGTIRSHDRVNFSSVDGQVDAPQDLGLFRAGVQVFDFKHCDCSF